MGGNISNTLATQCNTPLISGMQKSVTTSVRLPRELRQRVERRAASAGCGRNRVIIKALESYLLQEDQASYEKEARHQSQLAARLDPPDIAWDQMVERDLPGP
jgi:predicted DNA-binding protein